MLVMPIQLATTAEILACQTEHLPELLRSPHPDLQRACRAVREEEFGTAELEDAGLAVASFLARYRDLTGAGGAVAANQIGERRAVIAFAPVGAGTFAPEEVTLMYNPFMRGSGGSELFAEVCMSSVHIAAVVVRQKVLDMGFRRVDGEGEAVQFAGLDSARGQHEMDHLDGVQCLQRAIPGGVHPIERSDEVPGIKDAYMAAYGTTLGKPVPFDPALLRPVTT